MTNSKTGGPFLQIQGIRQEFGDIVAVHDVSLDVERGERVRLQDAGPLQTALVPDRVDDRLALAGSTRSDMDIAQQQIVLRAFVRHHVGDAAGADNQNVAFQRIDLRTGWRRNRRRRTRAPDGRCRRAP